MTALVRILEDAERIMTEALREDVDREYCRRLGIPYDIVPPGYWDRAREHLARLPSLTDEDETQDPEPLF